MSTQLEKIINKNNKIILVINFLINKVANWAQFYIKKKFYEDDEEDEIFINYNKFMEKITTAFEEIDKKQFLSFQLISHTFLFSSGMKTWDNDIKNIE